MEIRKPNRRSHTYTQNLVAGPGEVLPLLCPVREADWIEDWDPTVVFSESGLVEDGCVFMTASDPGPAIWFVTRHEPDRGRVEMLKIVPEVTACRLTIQVEAVPAGSQATVTYSHTSLGPKGDAFVAEFSEASYEKFMREWEERLNHYLKTGHALPNRVPAS